MNKKVYQKPSMKVIALYYRQQILTGSGVEVTRSNYGNAETHEWDSE